MSLPESISATGVVLGVAYAPVVWVNPRPELPTAPASIAADDIDAEIERFEQATTAVSERLKQRAEKVDGNAAEVLHATAKLTLDRGWHRAAKKAIKGKTTAELATTEAIAKFVDMFRSAGGLMAERTTDLEDIRDRVIAELRGEDEPGLPPVDSPSVLFADDLAPADTATLDPQMYVAMVTSLGGPTSHTAIIARQLGVPCVVAAGAQLHDIPAGTLVLVDGARGTIATNPDEHQATTAVAEAAAHAKKTAEWRGPGRTADGELIQLLANVGDGPAAAKAANSVAEGIGLFRTELCFLSAPDEPSLERQVEIYSRVFGAFPESKIVVRTLDAGSDKPLNFANLGVEENPSLGVRGLRMASAIDGLMERQLDAIAAAQNAADRCADAPIWVMAPMIATVAEAEWFAALCRDRGLVPGGMIEIPAAALMCHQLMKVLDFVSIGTNDLTQYAMAADRLSPHLAHLTDPWQPAVLRLIDMTCRSGKDLDTPVGVCGEAAADPLMAVVLVGLGVTSLSAAATALPGVGAQLADVTREQCVAAAKAALDAPDADSAREAARNALR
ncbi:phosphoenolpyruvate--protein phosphotransferase [Corynebacterium sp. TAE3-ERU12]|uniref:phosphoenolpyruvate--protein phosphotransferase n=1 Tax=Corynebacterium sp. TAE3-ERU12 TaxID=2849491 RepID=UPI001C488543|nr:phosphoenolpyruvate--protein phosphotransferase [Corynebacterium sp. TAE3-ERU12]MBV7295292.1 phosphoenolpyruvate--protein phosphotransferase [Corynebacterium sp. TAE3-ERU12]